MLNLSKVTLAFVQLLSELRAIFFLMAQQADLDLDLHRGKTDDGPLIQLWVTSEQASELASKLLA